MVEQSSKRANIEWWSKRASNQKSGGAKERKRNIAKNSGGEKSKITVRSERAKEQKRSDAAKEQNSKRAKELKVVEEQNSTNASMKWWSEIANEQKPWIKTQKSKKSTLQQRAK